MKLAKTMCDKSYTVMGCSTRVPRREALILQSMPAYLEGMLTAVALPQTYVSWGASLDGQQNWARAWQAAGMGFVANTSPPQILTALLVGGCAMHAALFYKSMYNASKRLKLLDRDFADVDSSLPIFEDKRRNFLRNLLFQEIWDASKQANLTVAAAYAEDALGSCCPWPMEISMDPKKYFPEWGFRRIQVKLGGAQSLQTILGRIAVSSGIRFYIKISIAAETYDALQKEGGFVSLEAAILMGLFAFVQVMPGLAVGTRVCADHMGGSAEAARRNALLLMIVLSIFFGLMLRQVGIFTCASRIFQLTSMGCLPPQNDA